MRRQISILLALLLFAASGRILAQGNLEIDPDVKKIMANYQQQNENIPKEILSLMPPGLMVTNKTWMAEPSTNMMLTMNLESAMDNVKLDNTEAFQLNLRISMTAYNLKSDVGKMMADQSLQTQRQGARDSWTTAHPETNKGLAKITTEKIMVPKGFILIQKTFVPAHGDGEGMVSERTTFTGFIYKEVEAGFLTAEVQTVPNTKTGIEKWLRHIESSAGKLVIGKYFQK
jgi:hypothetical protein